MPDPVEYDITETGRNANSATVNFRVTLKTAPTDEWVAVFHAFWAAEQGFGAVVEIRITASQFDFEVPLGPDAETAIRRCLDRTNEAVAGRQAEQ